MCPELRAPSVQAMDISQATTRTSHSRAAIVTGASRGLGRALAAGLAAAGYPLVIDARDGAELETARAAIQATGSDAGLIAIAGDVRDAAHQAALVQAADRLGGAYLLVNNAGTLGASPLPALADYPLDELRAAFEANVVAPVALAQALLPSLRRHGGAILNITSDAATRGLHGLGRLRRGQGRAGAGVERAGRRGERGPRLVGRSR